MKTYAVLQIRNLRPTFALCGFAAAILLASGGPAQAAEASAGTNAVSASLPLSEIILYSSGVGYFERSGDVEGRAQVDLRFKTEEINDLLKSLVVQDAGGGQVTTVTYGSRDPVTRALRSFGLDLTDNPTLGQLLNQARGEKAEVRWPQALTGTILGVEKRKQPVGEKQEMDVEYLNLVTEAGFHSIPMPQVQSVRLMNERLDGELRQALALLAASHDKDKKSVGITFAGTGKRKVSVSYVAQTPVWKTSYRLVLGEKGNPFLQGWAIVENTSDEDWSNVKLALVSGRPISFVMDLYQPLFVTRPTVVPELFSSLRPQVYEESMERPALGSVAATSAQMGGGRGMAAGRGGGGGGGMGGGGFGGGGAVNAPASAAPIMAETLARQRDASSFDIERSAASMATATRAGELFQYEIKTPVSLQRQKSAMLPIVNQNVAGDKVSIYNQAVQVKYPLNGFRLTNSTSLHLMQGPITVFEGDTYAGDARIDDIAPAQERLLSYGLDLKVEVEPQSGPGRNEMTAVVVKKGTVVATRKLSEEKTYNIRNRDQKKKLVLVEHPFRTDWELVEPKDKPERTRDQYRFAVGVEAERMAKLVVREERQISETATLMNSGNDMIAVYLRAQKISPGVKDALQKVVSLRDQLSQTTTERQRREGRINEITQEQARIRENMSRLNQSSELYNRYVKELDQQETDLVALRKEIESFKDTETRQRRDLDDYMLKLDVE